MRGCQSRSHVKWYCKYPVVFVPRYRRRATYGALRRQTGQCNLNRQAVFNMIFNNKDDHSKNFSFIMDKLGKCIPASQRVARHGHPPGRKHRFIPCSCSHLARRLME